MSLTLLLSHSTSRTSCNLTMEDHQIRIEEPSTKAPLINPEQTHDQEQEFEDTLLDQRLKQLEIFLYCFGFYQSSLLSFFLSWAVFAVVGIGFPICILKFSRCSNCDYLMKKFEIEILVSRATLAAVSLLCISHNLRKYGIRRFLFVDRYHGHMVRFSKKYVEKIQGFFRLLLIWISPCLFLEISLEIIRIIYFHDSWWQSIVISLGSVICWIYLTTISFLACTLFNLVCNFQVIHFDDYGKLLETDADVSVFMEEHIRLRNYLSKISHRFRIYLILELLLVTTSQLMALFQTTGYSELMSFIDRGDFIVTSIVQVVGITLCLHAATKISHRAQGVASVASRWHALMTFREASQLRVSNSVGNIEAANLPLSINFSESDMESLDNMVLPAVTQQSSPMTSYHKRKALVTYLQCNLGGFTIFGWTVDRTLVNTIFFLEFSLVLFVLGNTLTFSSK